VDVSSTIPAFVFFSSAAGAQFIAMMQKFVTPPSFLQPPIPIEELTLEHLDRIHCDLGK